MVLFFHENSAYFILFPIGGMVTHEDLKFRGAVNFLPEWARRLGKQSENLYTVGCVGIQLCLLSNFHFLRLYMKMC